MGKSAKNLNEQHAAHAIAFWIAIGAQRRGDEAAHVETSAVDHSNLWKGGRELPAVYVRMPDHGLFRLSLEHMGEARVGQPMEGDVRYAPDRSGLHRVIQIPTESVMGTPTSRERIAMRDSIHALPPDRDCPECGGRGSRCVCCNPQPELKIKMSAQPSVLAKPQSIGLGDSVTGLEERLASERDTALPDPERCRVCKETGDVYGCSTEYCRSPEYHDPTESPGMPRFGPSPAQTFRDLHHRSVVHCPHHGNERVTFYEDLRQWKCRATGCEWTLDAIK